LRTAEIRLPKALPNQEEGEPDRIPESASRDQRILIRLAHQATAPGRVAHDANAVAALARFFPDATSMQIRVQFARLVETGQSPDFSESVLIEFGTPREVLFSCKTPLEFDDVLKLRNSDGSFNEEARIVAVQYHPGKTLVAARFQRDVPNWIVKP
jgi:hypothetical protein